MKPYAWMFALTAVALGQLPHPHHRPLSSDEYAKVLEDPFAGCVAETACRRHGAGSETDGDRR